MTDLILPAPVWRRLSAWVYDALVFVALAMAAAALTLALLHQLQVDLHGPAAVRSLRAVLFLLGFLFFGWCWTHGGQTPGMRAWHIQVRSEDGSGLNWTAAAIRFATAVGGLGIVWALFNPRRRGWHDLIAGSEVVLLPRPQRVRSKAVKVTANNKSVGKDAESNEGQP